ncbi:MAG: alpha/beta hydrolase [Candidatus Diapherotrites archaeon]
MTNIFIFHGTAGFPEENWFPWLKKKLESINCEVLVPQFPTPKGQSLANWFNVFEKYNNFFNSNTILVSHSLGGAFLLRVLEKTKIKVKAAFIVSAPVGVLPIKNYIADLPFIKEPFDWIKIKKNCQKFYVFHSDNDSFISIGNGIKIAEELGTKLIVVPKAGHFNKTAGYIKFDLLFEKIKNELN